MALADLVSEARIPDHATWLCALPQYAVLKVSGKDALSFLQKNLTSDVTQVTENYSQLSSYCNPKGRICADFRIFQQHTDYFIRINQSIKDLFTQRIQKFILRDDVAIEESDYGVIGILGANAEALLRLNYTSETEPAQQHQAVDSQAEHNCTIVELPDDSVPAFEVYAPLKELEVIWETCQSHAQIAAEDVWKFVSIIKGLPEINQKTCEKFVPQMMNLDLLNAISFSKGCYPGQEIIARMHYRGNLKQRMYAFEINPPHKKDFKEIDYTSPIFAPQWSQDQALGSVVEFCLLKSKIIGLAVLRLAGMDQNLYLGSPQGSPVQLLPLPYEIPLESTDLEK